MDCPAAFELVLYGENQLPERARDRVRRHLEECPRCAKLLEDLQADHIGPKTNKPIPESLRRHLEGFEPLPAAPSDIQPGQIWLTTDVPGILLVVAVLENPDSYATYPLSTSTAYLSDCDLWLSRDDTPLGSAAMVQTWLNVPVDRQALGRFVGKLDQSLLESVERFRTWAPSEADRARVGPPLSGPEDPRYEFQRREMAFWRPASARAQEKMLALDEEAATASESPPFWLLKGHLGNQEVAALVESYDRETRIVRWFSYQNASVGHTMPIWAPSPTGTYSYLGAASFASIMTVSAAGRELSCDKPWAVGLRIDGQFVTTGLEPTAADQNN